MQININKIKELMIDNCFNVNDIAFKSGLSVPYVNKILRGNCKSTKALGKFAKALNCKASDIIIFEEG